MNTRPIACFFDHQEARNQIDLLKSGGIEAEVVTESDTSQKDNPIRIHCVVLDKVDETEAIELLDQRINEAGVVSLVRCPSCGSFHVEYPDRPRTSPSASFVGGIINKLGELANLSAKNFQCHSCGLTFPPSDAVTKARKESGAGAVEG